MKQKLQTSKRKGQSAIEYLMTYGWMLLVVAIVGGAIFATVQSNQSACENEVIDIESSQRGFGVTDFSTTSSNLNIQLENNQRDDVTVDYVNITTEDGTSVTDINVGQTIGFGDTYTVTTSAITQAEDCNTYNLRIEYDKGDLPDEITGQLKGQMAQP